MDGTTSHDLEEVRGIAHLASAPASLQADSVLDHAAVTRIEELHAAVTNAEAEQRFGLFGGKRSARLVEAEAAEQEFLNQHGFATYNDFRPRIRRSTLPTWGGSTMPAAGAPAGAASLAVEPFPEPGEAPEAPAEHINKPLDAASAAAAHDLGGEGPDHDGVTPPAPPDLGQVARSFFEQVTAEANHHVEARLALAEQDAAEIRLRANETAADILARGAALRDAVGSVVEDLARQAQAVMAAMEAAGPQFDNTVVELCGSMRSLAGLRGDTPNEA